MEQSVNIIERRKSREVTVCSDQPVLTARKKKKEKKREKNYWTKMRRKTGFHFRGFADRWPLRFYDSKTMTGCAPRPTLLHRHASRGVSPSGGLAVFTALLVPTDATDRLYCPTCVALSLRIRVLL